MIKNDLALTDLLEKKEEKKNLYILNSVHTAQFTLYNVNYLT